MAFRLPKYAEAYARSVFERTETLAAFPVWEGLDLVRLRRWEQNFEGMTERYFAACVLDRLIYRSDSQTRALAKQLFERSLADLVRRDPPPIPPIDDWRAALSQRNGHDPLIRIVPAVKSSDPPTKSGFVVGRLLKRFIHVSETWIIDAGRIDESVVSGAKILLFVDDFLGTGHEFEQFGRSIHLSNYIKDMYVIYAPLVAHDRGIQHLKRVLPGIRIANAERLRNEDSLFDAGSDCFEDGVNTPASATGFYESLLRSKGINLRGSRQFGYGGLGVAYAFQHAVPDDSLPLFWWNRSNSFAPLFDR